MTVPSFLSVTPASITSSGTFAITAAVTPTGTGAIVLQSSPTLTTPNIGAATGTSLNLSGLTASYSVHTDGSKNLVSIQNNGTGLNILQTSPTLITPNIGVASGTSLNLTSTTASTSPTTGSLRTAGGLGVAGDIYSGVSFISKRSGSVIRITGDASANTYIQSGIVETPGSTCTLNFSPYFSATSFMTIASTGITVPVAGITIAAFGSSSAATTATSIVVRNSSTATLELCVSGGSAQFSGTAVQGDSVIRAGAGNLYIQVGSGNSAVRITSTNNVEVRNILTAGSLVVTGAITANNLTASRVVFTDASKNLVSRPGFSYQLWNNSATTTVPNNTWTLVNNVSSVASGGVGTLTVWSGTLASFRNDSGVTMLYVCTFTSKPVATGINSWAMRIDCAGNTISSTEVNAGRNEVCITATGQIGSTQVIECFVNQYTGSSQTADGIRIAITTYPLL